LNVFNVHVKTKVNYPFAAQISRRRFARSILLSALAGTISGCAQQFRQPATARSSLRFVAVNDLHHEENACTPFMEALAAQIASHRPDFCLILGDLADTGRIESLEIVKQSFEKQGLEIFVVPGNHDCDLEENTRIYSEVFPDQLNYFFIKNGWQFIGFDSTDGKQWRDTVIGGKTLQFLDRTTRSLDASLPTIGFTHFPMSADAPMASTNAADALHLLSRLNVKAVFSGHHHGFTENLHMGRYPLFTHPCCSRMRNNFDDTAAEGYALCHAYQNGHLRREFVPFNGV
jgi:3',5'-cyclic AMP phosphodiesterase CpdA